MATATDSSETLHQIGEVAEAVGLSLRTIRHYEDVGLVPPSARSGGGFRLYTDADIDRLRLVRHMKPLDFSLEEMRDLLGVRDRLADEPQPPDRDRLVERLAMYAAAARERCDRLREQLDNAESFASRLVDEAEAGARVRPRERAERS